VRRDRRALAVNPACVYARISGYGQTGRYRDGAGFASEKCGAVREPSGSILPRVAPSNVLPGVVPKLTGTPGRVRRPARWTVGADTADVLGDLREEVEDLELLPSEGVV
jgi:crotonobetainyl-CoA:carnitine CoA-transferase CaiB-like acyl-CoA transferase